MPPLPRRCGHQPLFPPQRPLPRRPVQRSRMAAARAARGRHGGGMAGPRRLHAACDPYTPPQSRAA